MMVVGTMLWGAAFVFQGLAMDHIGPFTLGCLRFLIGSLVVSPLLSLKPTRPDPATDAPLKDYLIGGLVCGAALFGGVTFQQFGIQYTTAGKAGFITALYMIMVPFFAWLAYRRKIKKIVWLAVVVAMAGTFLLSSSASSAEGSNAMLGNGLVFVGAIFWAVQILCLERFGANLNPIKLAVIEFAVCAALSAIPMFVVEHPTLPSIYAALGPILYCGILSVGVAFTAQVICVKHVDAIIATLIMSLESVFAALFGFVLLGEKLGWIQLLGCFLVLCAVLMCELLPQLTKTAKE